MDVAGQTEVLLRSLKGVLDARVVADAEDRITRIIVRAARAEEKDVQRNVQSALMAVLGIRLEPGVLLFDGDAQQPVRLMSPAQTHVPAQAPVSTAIKTAAIPTVTQSPQDAAEQQRSAQVLDIAATGRRADLNEAARAAFDTLRNAQSVFHGFVFDGAELVSINTGLYVVVAIRRAATDARYCGAAPVVGAMATAAARALMNAVGIAAMGTPALELSAEEIAQLEKKQA